MATKLLICCLAFFFISETASGQSCIKILDEMVTCPSWPGVQFCSCNTNEVCIVSILNQNQVHKIGGGGLIKPSTYNVGCYTAYDCQPPNPEAKCGAENPCTPTGTSFPVGTLLEHEFSSLCPEG